MNRLCTPVLGLLLACAAMPARADTMPSVLVTTMQPHQGAVEHTVQAYGAAAQGVRSLVTVSVQHEGQVQDIEVAVGQRVAAGTPLLRVLASPATVSAYHQALTALALAETQHTHAAQMLTQHLATRDQVAQADKAVADAQATLQALRREGGDQGVQTVTAPFSGVVTAVTAAQGALVQANASLLTLARSDRMAVVVGLEPADQPLVHIGDPVRLDPETDGSGSLQGRVQVVGEMVDPSTRLLNVEIEIQSGTPVVGAVYRALISVGQYQGWMVPRDSVLSDAKGSYVFQVANGRAVRVDVQVVGAKGQTTIVQGPIQASHSLVTQGNYQLSDGMDVRTAGQSS